MCLDINGLRVKIHSISPPNPFIRSEKGKFFNIDYYNESKRREEDNYHKEKISLKNFVSTEKVVPSLYVQVNKY